MALTVSYKVSPEVVTAILYRETGGFVDINNLPNNKVVLDPLKTEHVYTDGVENTHYSFVIETTDVNGYKNYSTVQDILYKSLLGPGPTKITRGYFDFGVYGEMTGTEFGMTPTQVLARMNEIHPSMSNFSRGGSDTWYKCLVNNKIIFIPNSIYTSGVFNTTHSANEMYKYRLVDSNGGIDTCTTIAINGYEYKWRSIAHHDTNLTGAEALEAMKSSDVVTACRSELNMLNALILSTTPGLIERPLNPNSTSRIFRGGEIPQVGSDSKRRYVAAGNSIWPSPKGILISAYSTGNKSEPTLGTVSASDTTTVLIYTPVLELLN